MSCTHGPAPEIGSGRSRSEPSRQPQAHQARGRSSQPTLPLLAQDHPVRTLEFQSPFFEKLHAWTIERASAPTEGSSGPPAPASPATEQLDLASAGPHVPPASEAPADCILAMPHVGPPAPCQAAEPEAAPSTSSAAPPTASTAGLHTTVP